MRADMCFIPWMTYLCCHFLFLSWYACFLNTANMQTSQVTVCKYIISPTQVMHGRYVAFSNTQILNLDFCAFSSIFLTLSTYYSKSTLSFHLYLFLPFKSLQFFMILNGTFLIYANKWFFLIQDLYILIVIYWPNSSIFFHKHNFIPV